MVGALKRGGEVVPDAPSFVILTGLSGAGRSEAAHALEDLGYYVVDNLPPPLIGKMVELVTGSRDELRHVALVVDVRSRAYFEQLEEALRDIPLRGLDYKIVFMTASVDVLVRRYEEKKRKHPLAEGVTDGIALERSLLEGLREAADVVIDTSDLNVHELRDRVVELFSSQTAEERLQTTVLSFGFKYGIPVDADMVLDVRFLPNPYWEDDLRPLVGTDPRVRTFVMGHAETTDFLEGFDGLLDTLVPGFLKEGKRYLTVAIGCTGGRHRSVVVAGQIGEMMRRRGLAVAVRHRDSERD